MLQIEFTGHVEPRFLQINAHGGPIPWKDKNLPPFAFSYRIDKAEVGILCDIQDVDEFAVNYVHLVVYSYISSVINCLAFATAHGFTLILESCTVPGMEPAPLRSHSPALPSLCSFTSQEILDVVMKDRRILKPLNDLTDTLRNPMDSYVNIQRAIEGLCRLVSDEKDRHKRWEALRDNLKIGRPYLQFISDLSTEARHGATTPVEMVTVANVQMRGWTIMNRFLEFWKRGKTALPISEFPLL
jgi:hypothetical protein